VDTEALLKLLQEGRIRAALDVTDPEPLPSDHPLWDAPGVLITPHFAGDTLAADRRAFALVGDQVRRYVSGEPLANVVEHGY
jgi:phosphoglycerate dehydrogenase-like enzyme